MKETLNQIQVLNEQLISLKEELEKKFKVELKKIFVDNPTLDQIQMYVNNHEFNDGDTTYFEIGYEDLKIVVNGEEIEREWDRETGDYKSNPLIESLINLFGSVHCIHENLYGGYFEHLTIDREEVLNYEC